MDDKVDHAQVIHHPTKFGPFSLLHAGSYTIDPDRKRYLVEGWWGFDSIGLLVADPKTGKTWFALILAFAIASGRPFLGKFKVEQGPVIMFSPEGNRAEFHDRVRQIGERMGLDPNSLPLYFIEDIPQLYLDDKQHQDYLTSAIKEIHPALVIFDPLEKSLRGGFLRDEEVKPATDYMDLVRRKFGCSFMVAHHTSKGDAKSDHGRIKGAGLLFSFGDCYIYLGKQNEQVRVTSNHKNIEEAEPFNVEMVKVEGNTMYEIVDADSSVSEKKPELYERIIQFLAINHKKKFTQVALREELKGDFSRYGPLLNKLKNDGQVREQKKPKGWKITAQGKKTALEMSLVPADHFEPKEKKKTVKRQVKNTTKKQAKATKK